PLGVRKTFVYSVPDRLKTKVTAGVRVLVPFGRKIVSGVIVATLEGPPDGDFKIRPIRDVVDLRPILPASLVETARWTANRFFAPPGEILRASLPAGTGVSGALRISLTPRTETLLLGGLRPPFLRPQENLILDHLRDEGAATLKQLAKSTGLKDAGHWAESLAAASWVRMEEVFERPRVSSKRQLAIRALPAASERLAGLTDRQRALYSRL